MKRKILNFLLCGVIVCSTLTACGGSDSSNDSADSAESEASTTVEKSSEEDDTTNQGKTSATILDAVKYHNDIDYESDYSMMETAKSYLKDKGITFQEDGAGIVSTISDDFLGYRAYYGWDGDDYSIYLTFDTENELKQAVSDVRDYLSSRSDSDFESSDFCEAVEEKNSRWGAILYWYESGEVFCTDYNQDDEKIYIEATSFNVYGGLSRLRTENEAEYILGDCDSFIEIMVAGKAFGINTDFSAMTDDGKFEAAAAESAEEANSAEEATPVEDTASDTSQSTVSEDHDYRISMDNIDYLELGRDGYLSLKASCNLYDEYTRDPAGSADSFSCEVSADCTTLYYGDTIPDANSFIEAIIEDWLFIQDAKNNNRDIGDVDTLQVVIENGKITFMQIISNY